MNFKKAINIVLNEAESSALGECASEGAEVLEACQVVNLFVRYLPKEFTNDDTPNKQKMSPYTDFCDDAEKMVNFSNLSKDDFLKSYSYITEEEYNLTRIKYRENN